MDEVTGSVILGQAEFINVIRDNYLSGKKVDRETPALRELAKEVSLDEIDKEIENKAHGVRSSLLTCYQ